MPAIDLASSSIHLELHPAARAAYEWCTHYPRWINWSNLPKPMATELSQEPLRGIMLDSPAAPNDPKSTRTFQLFAPLWTIQLWSTAQPPDGTILIDYRAIKMTDEQIEHAAWLSALSSLLGSVNPLQISEIRDSLAAHMPIHTHREILQTKTLNDPMLCRWTGLSRGTLLHQRRQKKSREQIEKASLPNSIDDVLDALKKPWSPDD